MSSPAPSENRDPAQGRNEHSLFGLPPQVLPPQLSPDRQISALEFDLAEYAYLDEQSKYKTYGAPRVFDLFTLLAITLAFASLFALLGLLAPALDISTRGITVTIGVYVSLVGFSQMLLFGSNNPRVASLISGPIALALVTVYPLIEFNGIGLGVFLSAVVGISIGPITGYLAGAVVAGVFLVADKFRTSFLSSNSELPETNFDNIQ